jgi:tetratricopeptide (TPR) repeat protein
MRADCLILQICDFLDDGDGQYRLHEPSRHLSRLPGVAVVDCHFYHRHLPALIDAADVLVLPFLHDWDLFATLERRRAAGTITVFEANDYFSDVQPWSPIARQWQDRAIQEEYRHFLAAADGVQTSTQELARRWQPLARRVAVFANQLTDVPPLTADPSPPRGEGRSEFPPLPSGREGAGVRGRSLTIGWGGSPGHFADWYHVAPYLQTWLNAHPDVHLAVMTHEFARPFIQLPAERYHFANFGSLAEYLRFLPRLDIGLAPLLPTDYNRGRSDVKFLEYAAHGVAGIYADLEPYRASVTDGETGLLYRDGPELLRCLDRLAGDAGLRQRIRTQAHAHVSQQRRLADHIGERLDFYRALLRGGSKGGAVDDALVAEAVRDGDYYQLRPGEPEKTLLAALQPSADAGPLLSRLVQQYPDYIAALQNFGKWCNDRGDYPTALRHLERARALQPHSARTRCEIGRSRFLVKDMAAARRELEAALQINPHYYPGWQYLLRLLTLHRAADGPRWAERAGELFPACYALAWAAAGVYEPAEGVRVLQAALERYAAGFKPEEMADAALALGQAVMELAGPRLATPAVRALLERACEVFPDSARLAHLLGVALHWAGAEEASQAHFRRALAIQRTATLYRGEFPQDDGSIH